MGVFWTTITQNKSLPATMSFLQKKHSINSRLPLPLSYYIYIYIDLHVYSIFFAWTPTCCISYIFFWGSRHHDVFSPRPPPTSILIFKVFGSKSQRVFVRIARRTLWRITTISVSRWRVAFRDPWEKGIFFSTWRWLFLLNGQCG